MLLESGNAVPLDSFNILISEEPTQLEPKEEKTETFIVGHKGSCGEISCDDNLRKENFLSEFKHEYEKAKVRKNLGISSNETLRWGNIQGFIEEQADLKKRFDEINKLVGENLQKELEKKIDKEILEGVGAIGQIRYENDAYPNIKTLQDALDQMLYKDLVISTFTCTPSVKESGEIVDKIVYQWSYNKNNIKAQWFNEEQLDDVSIRSLTLEGPFNNNKSATIKGFDGTKEISKTVTLKFYPGIYYGDAVNVGENLNKFQRILQGSRSTTITVTSSNYIFIYIPYTYGVASFNVGGFDGGFTLMTDNFTLEKNKVKYRVYRSDNKGLGTTTIKIS